MWKLIESPLMEKIVTLWNRIWSPKQANKSEPCGAPSRVLIFFGYCCLLLLLTTIFLFTLDIYPSLPIYTHTICPAFADKSERRGGEGEMRGVGGGFPFPPSPLHPSHEAIRVSSNRISSRSFEAIRGHRGHLRPFSSRIRGLEPRTASPNTSAPRTASLNIERSKIS